MPLAYALLHQEGGVLRRLLPGLSAAWSPPAERRNWRSAADRPRCRSMSPAWWRTATHLPMLRSLDELQADPAYVEDSSGAALVMVPFDLPGRAVRVNISIDEHLLDAVDRAAEAAGLSRSAFLAEAARQRLRAA